MHISAQTGSTGIKDLGLATTLVSLGFQILGTQRDERDRAYFIFDDDPQLKQKIDDYWANTVMVPARTYSDNLKMLKTRIYSGQ